MINKLLLEQMIAENYIKINKHPEYDLYIYNYTQKAQYNRVWNEITLMCRGLILNEKLEVVARPFPKFFNLGEMENQYIPDSTFEVFDKMDGSLGILYFVENEPYIASRGSFSSIQSDKANEMLHGKYKPCWENLDPKKTYLFEIIYPENRIVLDYGDDEKLVLLAIIDTQSGDEFPLEDLGFPVVEKYDGFNDFTTLKNLNLKNKEGFIIKFANNYRLKIKFDEYLRLHRILTECSTIDIWECLKEGLPLNDFLENVPDEFYEWVKNVKADLLNQYKTIENECKNYFKVFENRKDTAAYFIKHPHHSVLFSMLDNKDYSPIIWKKIKPEFQKPFIQTNLDL